MALIKCPECGHDLSTRAQYCMNCGCPNDDYDETANMTSEEYDEYLKQKEIEYKRHLDNMVEEMYRNAGLRSPSRGFPLWPMY